MEQIKTPFMEAEDRAFAQFTAEIESLGIGLKVNTRTIGGMYAKDSGFIADLETEYEPLKGNKSKVEALRNAGYTVFVFAPYDKGGKRYFVAHSYRRLEVT